MGIEPASDPRGDEDGGMESREEKPVAEGFEKVGEGSSAKDPGLKEVEAQRSRTACDVVRSDLADGCFQAAEGERTELGCSQKVVEMSIVAVETVQGDVLDGEGNFAKGESNTEVLEDQLLNPEKKKIPANDVMDCALIDRQHQLNVRGATVLKTETLFGDEEKHDVDFQDFDDGHMLDAEGLEELEPERALSVHEKLEVDLADTGSGLGTAKAETVVSLGLSEGKRLEGIGIEFVESSITDKVLKEVPQDSSAKEYSLGGGHAQMNNGEAGATEDVAEAAIVISSKGSGCEYNMVVQGSDGNLDAIEDVQDARGSETEALLGNDQNNDVEAQELHGGKMQATEGLQRCFPGKAPSSYQKLEIDMGNIQNGLGTARAESVVDLGVVEGQRMEDAVGVQLVRSSIMAKALVEVAGSSAKEQQLADGHAQGEGGAETTHIVASGGIGKKGTEGVQESYGDQDTIEGFCIGNGVLEEAQSSKEDKPSTYNDTTGAELNDKSIQAVEGKMGFRNGGERTELAGDQKAVTKAGRIGTLAEIIPVMSVETVEDDGFNGKANLAMGGTDAPMGGCGLDKAEIVVSLVVEEGENIEDVAANELVKGRNAAEVSGEVAWGSLGKEPSLSHGHAHIGIAEAGTFEGVAETASMIGSEGIANEHTKIMEKLDCEQNDLEVVCTGRGVPEEAESSNKEKPSTTSDSMGNDGLLQFVEGQTCFTSKGERHELGGDEKAESFRMVAKISRIVAVETVEDGVLKGKENLAKGETGVAEISLGTEVMDQFSDLKEEIPENDLVGCGLIDQHRQEDTPDARHLETALFGDEQKHDMMTQDLHDGHLQTAERLQDCDPRKESSDNEKLEVNVVDTGNGLRAAKPEAVVCLGMAEDKGSVGKSDGNFILDVQSDFSENKDVKLVDENLDNKDGTIVADSCFILQAEKSSVLPQEKDCTDCLTGQNQEIENPLASQNFGTSPYKVDSDTPTSDIPPILEDQNVESIQQSKVDQKNPVLGGNVAIAVMQADTSDYQQVQIEDNSLERKTMEYAAERSGTSATENDHHASYYLPFLDKETFAVSDLVWGKVKSHPWWPGQIFYPSDASDMALKHQKKDNILVAYFGDKTFAWCDETQLKPFETNFSHMEKQSTSDLFVDSVNSVLGEVSRRVELGMSCSCLPEELHVNKIYENFENAGIREGVSNCHINRSQILNYLHPDRLLEYIKTLASLPTLGTDRLELVIAKAQLNAFYRSKGYPELPVFQIGATIGNDPEALSPESDKLGVDSFNYSTAVPVDINPGKPKSRGRGRPKKQNHILEDTLEDKRFSESMEEKSAFNLADVGEIHDEITIDDELTSLSGKKRKFIDFDSSDSAKVTYDRLDLLEDFDTKLPSPTFGSSFKLGECIRRVASRLTGFPPTRKFHGETNQNSVSKSENMTFDDLSADISSPTDVEKRKKKVGITKNYSSSDEMFSQLCLAARDPMKGYSFLSIIISFFTNFRNFSVSSSSEETKHGEKVGGKRGRKRKINTQSSPSEMSTDDHMQDSYWSDLISSSGPISGLKRREEVHTRWHRKKRRSSGEASISPFSDSPLQHRQVGTITSNMKQTMTTGRSIINVEEKIVGECTPTALLLSFNGSNFLPSETDLIRIFSRFGPLKEAETEVQRKTNSVKVVFKRRSDAERAFSSAGKYSIFGPSLLSYRLKSEIHPSIIQQEKDSETSNGVGSLEFPGQLSDIHPSIIQEKDTETPNGVGSSEVPDRLPDIPPTIIQEEKDSETPNGIGSSEVPGQPSNNLSIIQQDKDSETLNEFRSSEVPGLPFDMHPSILQQEDSETPNGVGSWEITGQPSGIHLSPMQQDEDSETPNGIGSLGVPCQPSDIHPSIMQQGEDSETPDGVGSLEIPGQPSDIHVSIMQQDEDSETHNGFGSSEVLGQPSDIHLRIMQQDEDSEAPDGVGSSEFPVQPSDIHPIIMQQDEDSETPGGVGSSEFPVQPSDIHSIIMQQDEDSETPDGVGSSEVLGQPSDVHPSIMQQDKDCETPDGVGISEFPGQTSYIHPSITQQNEDSETPDGVVISDVSSKPSDIHPSIIQQDKDSKTPNGFGSLEVPAPEGTKVLSDTVQTETAEEGSVEMVIETSEQPHN